MGKLEGKVAIVTGGAMGMGNGAVRVMAKYGAKVGIIDKSDTVYDAAKCLCKEGYEVVAYKVDVRDAEAMKEAYKDVVEKFGKLDIVVNAAGIGILKPFLEVTDEFFNTTFDVNFKGVWNSCKAAIPYMVKQKYGKVVNFSSVTGNVVVDPGMTSYGASKGAISALTKALASEFASYNITVNAILPGMVDTPMLLSSCQDACPEDPESVKKAIAASIPMGRLGTILEAGEVVAFLASDESSYVTGVNIVFDGGSTLPETPGTGWSPEV